MSSGDGFLRKWVSIGALAWVGVLGVWADRPAGQADTDVWAAVGLLVMLGLPPGLALAALSARYGSRAGALPAVVWLAVCLFALWFVVISVTLVFAGELFYCEGSECETKLLGRVAVMVTASTILRACASFEIRLRRRCGAASGPS